MILSSQPAIPGAHETSVSPPRDSVLTQPLTQAFASQQGEEVFKKPVDKPTKKSPVSVDTANLQLPCLRDVEMLSAQSTDGSKAMDTQTPRTPMAEKQVRVDFFDLKKITCHCCSSDLVVGVV